MVFKKLISKFGFVFSVIAVSIGSFDSLAASLTTYRIYLDNSNRSESFVVFSNSKGSERCSLDFKYFNFDEFGNMSLHRDEKPPVNAAEEWVRYSPRNFVLEPSRPQTIRFSMRRKPNSEANEYRSYISIACDAVDNTNDGLELPKDRPTVQVKPKLVQNVPLIIRTGVLDAEASFSGLSAANNVVKGKLLRSGKRSIYGDLSLINTKTNEEVGVMKSISIYPETSSYEFKFPYSGSEKVSVRFTEDTNYGGSLVIEKEVN
jgi:hypothetical protein